MKNLVLLLILITLGIGTWVVISNYVPTKPAVNNDVVATVGTVVINQNLYEYALIDYNAIRSDADWKSTELRANLAKTVSPAKRDAVLTQLIEQAALINYVSTKQAPLESAEIEMMEGSVLGQLFTNQNFIDTRDTAELTNIYADTGLQEYVTFLAQYEVALASFDPNSLPPLPEFMPTEAQIQATYDNLKAQEPNLPPLNEIREEVIATTNANVGQGDSARRLNQIVQLTDITLTE